MYSIFVSYNIYLKDFQVQQFGVKEKREEENGVPIFEYSSPLEKIKFEIFDQHPS